MIRITLGALFIGATIFALVKLLAPSRDAIALYIEEQEGHRVYDSYEPEFLLQAHFVLIPSGRQKMRSLEERAFLIEARRLRECYEAAPQARLCGSAEGDVYYVGSDSTNAYFRTGSLFWSYYKVPACAAHAPQSFPVGLGKPYAVRLHVHPDNSINVGKSCSHEQGYELGQLDRA